jgi:hypothetical protein
MRDGTLRVVSLSNRLVRYSWSLALQEALAADRKADAAPDTLLMLQVRRWGGGCIAAAAAVCTRLCMLLGSRGPAVCVTRLHLALPLG